MKFMSSYLVRQGSHTTTIFLACQKVGALSRPSLCFVTHTKGNALQLWTFHARRWRSFCGGGCCLTAQRSFTASFMVRYPLPLRCQQGLLSAIYTAPVCFVGPHSPSAASLTFTQGQTAGSCTTAWLCRSVMPELSPAGGVQGSGGRWSRRLLSPCPQCSLQ